MKRLPDRRTIDAKFTRWTLVSQWPLLLREWVDQELTSRVPGASLRSWLRGLFACAICVVAMFAVLYAVAYALLGWLPSAIAPWLILCSGTLIYGSFHFSMVAERPIALFWLIAKMERPTRLAPASGPGPSRERCVA